MRRRRSIVAAPALLTAVLLTGACSSGGDAPAAADGYVRLAAVPGRPAAAYFTVHGGAKDMTLVQVEAPGVPRVELHNSRTTANGLVAMDSIPSVGVPARSSIAFAPGGRHAMLYDVPATVKPGATLPLTLRFADGSAVATNARVIAPGDSAPTG